MVAPKHVWSKYQKEIFINIAKGEGHLMVVARAGSAKSTTIVEGAKYIPKGKTSLFCAFNKSIQEELKKKLPSYCLASTLHSLGFKAIKNRFGPNVQLDNYKCWNIVENFFHNPKDQYDLIDNICKTVGFCKANLTDAPSQIEEIIIKYDIDLCGEDPKDFILMVIKALRQCKEMTDKIDFTDMIWFPFIYNLNPGKYDYVFVDEAQDLNVAQIELALSAVKPGGRVIVVLDNFQAIYFFAGADSEMFDKMKARLNPTELSLPICYRCPLRVVYQAQKYVPDIQAHDKAIEGKIDYIDIADLQKLAKPGSYVLSRTNAPLIKHCLKFLKAGIPANMLGRDIGDGLLYLIKKSKKKRVDAFLNWVYDWAKTEKRRILSKYPKASTEIIDDKVECMENLCDGAKNLEEVKKNIENLFKENDEKKIVLFSSVHKIKGKQQNDVFILSNTLRYSNQEELNIVYVAITRAQKNLYFVSDKSKSTIDKEENADNKRELSKFELSMAEVAYKHHGDEGLLVHDELVNGPPALFEGKTEIYEEP